MFHQGSWWVALRHQQKEKILAGRRLYRFCLHICTVVLRLFLWCLSWAVVGLAGRPLGGALHGACAHHAHGRGAQQGMDLALGFSCGSFHEPRAAGLFGVLRLGWPSWHLFFFAFSAVVPVIESHRRLGDVADGAHPIAGKMSQLFTQEPNALTTTLLAQLFGFSCQKVLLAASPFLFMLHDSVPPLDWIYRIESSQCPAATRTPHQTWIGAAMKTWAHS